MPVQLEGVPAIKGRMELEQAYRTYRALLIGAVARLARQGFHSPSVDALDLVHDFFLDEWESVRKNYDDRRGSLRSYLYAAFTRYARHVLVRHMRFNQQSLSDLEELAAGSGEEAEQRIDALAVSSALMKIPSEERMVLDAFLEVPTERAIARRLKLSRHIVHEMLVRALARVALDLERPAGVNEEDWKVTRMILGREATVRTVARELGISPGRVREIHRRNLRQLIAPLRQGVRAPATVRGE